MANAEKLIPLILLLVLLHLFRPGKKHGPFFIASFIYCIVFVFSQKNQSNKTRENDLAQLPTQMFLGYCHVFLPLKLLGGLRDEPNLQIDSSK